MTHAPASSDVVIENRESILDRSFQDSGTSEHFIWTSSKLNLSDAGRKKRGQRLSADQLGEEATQQWRFSIPIKVTSVPSVLRIVSGTGRIAV